MEKGMGRESAWLSNAYLTHRQPLGNRYIGKRDEKHTRQQFDKWEKAVYIYVKMETIKKEVRRITVKQRKWIREYIRCGNATEASMRTYNVKDRPSAGVIGCQNIKKLRIPFLEMMEIAGLTDENDIVLLNKLRNAQKQQVCDIYVDKDGDGEYKINKNQNSFIVVDDNQTQFKALELTQKLKGRLKDSNGNGKTVLPT